MTSIGFSYAFTVDGRLFISGGMGKEGKMCEVVKDKLEERPKMINSRWKHCLTLFSGGECLMATGGRNKVGSLKKCEVFAIEKDQWSKVAPMNEARQYHSALEVKKGILYVFCGHNGLNYLNSIEYFT